MRVGSILLALVLLTGARPALTQGLVPEAGLAAEMAGRWEDALRVYREALERDPKRADLWVRIADIEARRGRVTSSVHALERAVEAAPGNPQLYERLSQAYASGGSAAAALSAIEGALHLEPRTVEYLEARATLATWLGDYGRAQESYRRLLDARPGDPDVSLRLARVSAWAGDTDEAARAYRRYLDAHPDSAEVWLELTRAESWRGNYAAALDVLGTYRARFGAPSDYARELADVTARADRPTQAIKLLEPLLQRDPEDYQLNLIRTLAFAKQRKIREARDTLDSVRRLQPDRPETRSAERVVRALIGSTVEPQGSLYSDSDGLSIRRLAPLATIALASGTRLDGGFERHDLRARAGSGLEQTGGGLTSRHESVWFGAGQHIGRVELRGQIGRARVPDRRLTTYAVTAEIRPADTVEFSLERRSDFVVISPRTVGLGLTRLGHGFRLGWDPALSYRVELDAWYEALSDGNDRWTVALSPRRRVARTQRLNLDLGLAARWFGASRDLDHGYYDTSRYESYSFVAFPYWKIAEDAGLSLSLAIGTQRDGPAPFRLGAEATGEATVGIYDPWVLKASVSGTLNPRLESGAYRGFGGSLTLVRRF